jgi:hypothetical protein
MKYCSIMYWLVLLYYPVDLEETQTVETLGEEDIYVTVENGNVMINNSATVATADLEGSNGVVHIIDGVLLPNAFLPVTGIVQKTTISRHCSALLQNGKIFWKHSLAMVSLPFLRQLTKRLKPLLRHFPI